MLLDLLTGKFGFLWVQENILQKFKLPEPVLCIGGILQVELLGRVQRQQLDGLYYIWSVPLLWFVSLKILTD